MPTPRKPVEPHVLDGSYKKNPSRKSRSIRKSPHTLGDAPEYFGADEWQYWEEISQTVAIYVTAVDSWIAETACQLMAKLRHREASASDIGKLIHCLSVMGMTPAD